MRQLQNVLTAISGPDYYSQLPALAANNLEEVLAALPRIDSLPTASELQHFEPGAVLVVEEDITIASLRRHLHSATAKTPEIELEMFENGAQVLEVGTIARVRSSSDWRPFRRRRVADLHTHPYPEDPEHMRLPSIDDVDVNSDIGFFTIGSPDGFTYVPRHEGVKTLDGVHELYWSYAKDRDLDFKGIENYGAGKFAVEFIKDVIKPQFTPWELLDPRISIAQIALDFAKQ